MTENSSNSSSLKTIYLEGESPWGFRISDEKESKDFVSNILPSLVISKVFN